MTALLEWSPSHVARYDTINQLDILVGNVLAASRVPHSKKLIALQVDVGEPQPRCILTGSKPPRPPDLFVGRQVAVGCNVPPRELVGLVRASCAAFNLQGQALLVAAHDPVMAPFHSAP